MASVVHGLLVARKKGQQYTNENHPDFDDPTKYIYYRYYPSLPAAIIFIVLFFITTTLHSWQAWRKRSLFMIPLIVGGVFQTVGYIGRALSAKDQWSLTNYIIQACLLLVAPALFAATIYMTLGRIILLVQGEHHAFIKKRFLTKMFVAIDVLSFVMQGAGAGLMAGGTQKSLETGESIVIGGLVVQIVGFSLFVSVALLFHRRILRAPTQESRPESGIAWQKHLYALYGASILILIRSIFRVIEYAMGNNGYLLKKEVFLYVFDSVLMLGVMVLLNVIHPGEIITKRLKHLRSPSTEDGEAQFVELHDTTRK